MSFERLRSARALARLVFVALLATGLGTAAAQEPELDVAPPSVVVGEPASTPLTGEKLESETERVAALVRCPVCQGLSVLDSPAPMAVKMRKQIRELLAEGYAEDQILSYFERSYGEFVLLDPPLRGINWVVWLAPLLLLVVGGVVVVRVFRRSGPSTASAMASEHADGDEIYLRKVRHLAYGDGEDEA